MNSDQAGKTAEEIKSPEEMIDDFEFLKPILLPDLDGEEIFVKSEIVELMLAYHSQFVGQVEEPGKDREIERLNEELKKYIGAIDAMMNMSDELTELRKLKK